jgi:hypothetical protein
MVTAAWICQMVSIVHKWILDPLSSTVVGMQQYMNTTAFEAAGYVSMLSAASMCFVGITVAMAVLEAL